MRLRRRHDDDGATQRFIEFAAPLAAGCYFAVEENLERCARLTREREAGVPAAEVRDEALAGARRIAHVSRATFGVLTSGAIDPYEIPQDLFPLSVLEAMARLGYALVGLAEDEPEPEQLLTEPELDGLLDQYGLRQWYDDRRAETKRGHEDRA